ncbi:hypothetical protein BUALT_Bualt04G0061900 [Buddleja alternifolia]|uniref:PsbP C-terminal domain-containing protein n=1 Tax=Buddleja alternifolia TaxID=168488 RepID=A0AAV6XUW2_9LAMI|nr:hypothetical protein BUALT_Bualt04G0061900 [Buddleja alternifolia]
MLRRAMASRAISIPFPSNHHHHFLIVQNLATIPAPLPPPTTKPRSSRSSSPFSTSSYDVKRSEKLAVGMGRRIIMLNLSIAGFLLSFDQPFSKTSKAALASQLLEELHRYTDSKQGFTLLIPTSWIKVDKAGATVLFVDTDEKANNVGVVVSPTRISSLGEFGTPQFVADKLIQAERRKESTKEAEVISVSERSGRGGLQVYEFEYKLDSTRGGLKRVFSAAFVASKRLYLLNITHSDGLENPLDMERRMIMEQVMHSFDAVPST